MLFAAGSTMLAALLLLVNTGTVKAEPQHNSPEFAYGSRLHRISKEELREIYSYCHYDSHPSTRGDRVMEGISERIIGGEDANVGDFPAAASFRSHSILPNIMSVAKCGGTLLTWRHVITSGECVKG